MNNIMSLDDTRMFSSISTSHTKAFFSLDSRLNNESNALYRRSISICTQESALWNCLLKPTNPIYLGNCFAQSAMDKIHNRNVLSFHNVTEALDINNVGRPARVELGMSYKAIFYTTRL